MLKWIHSHDAGCGLMGELNRGQSPFTPGSTALQLHVATYKTLPNPLDTCRLKCIMKEHYFKVSQNSELSTS